MGVFVFEEIQFGDEFCHFYVMFLFRVFECGHGDVFARDEVFHVHGGVGLFFWGEVVVEVYSFYFSRYVFFFVGFYFLFVLFVGDECWSVIILIFVGFVVAFLAVFELYFFD